MTNNVEGCIKKHDERGGGGLEMSQNSMTSFMDGPLEGIYRSSVLPVISLIYNMGHDSNFLGISVNISGVFSIRNAMKVAVEVSKRTCSLWKNTFMESYKPNIAKYESDKSP